MKLILPPDLRERIDVEARASFPRECCGLIEGLRDGDVARAFALHPTRNIAARADRFEIAPEDHFAALKMARTNGQDLIGCYHSHPGGRAEPSLNDRQGAGEEGFLWLIASLAHGSAPATLAAFVYSAPVFLPAELLCAVGADLVTSSEKARN